MSPPAFYLLDPAAFAEVFGPAEQEHLAAHFDFLSPGPAAALTAFSAADLARVEVIFSGWGVPVMDAVFLEKLPHIRAVFHAAGTVKTFVTPALWARSVRVTGAARANAIPVAEFTLAQVIFALKHGWQRVAEIRTQRSFRKSDPTMPGSCGSTVGLLSLGHTGRLVAERLRALEVNVLAYDPHVAPEDAARLGVTLCSLDEIFARADVVTCHTPLLPDTTHLLRRAHFARMKPGATFINTARGAIVHEPELIAVLRARADLTAVLDVTDPEPPAPNSPLFTLPNVVLTPHIAGSLGPECLRLGRMMVEEADRYLRGEPLIGEIFADQIPFLA